MRKLLMLVVLGSGLAAAFIYFSQERKDNDETAIGSTGSEQLQRDNAEPKPEVRFPVPEITNVVSENTEEVEETPVTQEAEVAAEEELVLETKPPLPALDESDSAIENAMMDLSSVESPGSFLIFKSFVRHFVVTVDNLTNQKIPRRYFFAKAIPDKFMVIAQDTDTAVLDNKNYQRYTPVINYMNNIENQAIVNLYFRYYPLFQEAYESLGYPDRYFNDRLIDVIDHLLAAPEIRGEIPLVRPKVFYQFADPELESLSAGQKMMIRMGGDNAAQVKQKLKNLRYLLSNPAA